MQRIRTLVGHIDHVISEKHGGKTQEVIPLFNPRKDRWGDHFHLAPDGITILPLTPVGEVTIRVLQLNESSRLLERKALQEKGRYPMPAAKKRL
jgi:hypothetical protein